MFSQAAIKRKSIRSFSDLRFGDELRAEIADMIRELKPLYDDAVTNFRFCPGNLIRDELKGNLVHAPYYIIISARRADGYLENAGFMAEQLVIKLVEKGIGSCYCGMGKPTHSSSVTEEYCITLALGFPSAKEKWRESASEFKRKDFRKILIGDKENDFLEPFIQFARLAPSAVNMQPVVWEMSGTSINVYRKVPKLSKLEALQRMDTGIALAHIFMYAAEQGYHIDVFKDGNTKKDKLIYFLTLNIMEENKDE